ncbi:MAG: NAD(P)H-dependent oxidoreductase [Spirochaetales bacterium]|nr:NAD(P)H-dependent oxidoreductase [Spirochaetales bacterium]
MKASVILAHPYPKSLNHAIYGTAADTLRQNGAEVFAHDLYDEGFDPVLSKKELGTDKSGDTMVNRYAEELTVSDYLIFIHPNWWGQPPAILKGYIDRVIRPPYAYDFPADGDGGLPIEKLSGKLGLVYNTSNTDADREENYFGDPLEKIWKQCIFGFLGMEMYRRRMFRIVADSSEKERTEWLDLVAMDMEEICRNPNQN